MYLQRLWFPVTFLLDTPLRLLALISSILDLTIYTSFLHHQTGMCNLQSFITDLWFVVPIHWIVFNTKLWTCSKVRNTARLRNPLSELIFVIKIKWQTLLPKFNITLLGRFLDGMLLTVLTCQALLFKDHLLKSRFIFHSCQSKLNDFISLICRRFVS